jgi:beta-lactam-binding protein with PASTA domain
LDEPKRGSYYGGDVSAPIFRAVAQRINPLLNRARRPSSTVVADAHQPSVPDVVMLDVEQAQAALQELGLKVRTVGKGEVVIDQSPVSGVLVQRGSLVTLQTERAAVPQGFALVPDVRGFSLRRAMARLRMEKLDVALNGSGRVVEQTPPPGTQIRVGSTVNLRCAPKSVPLAGLYE